MHVPLVKTELDFPSRPTPQMGTKEADAPPDFTETLKVFVRVRPLNQKEIEMNEARKKESTIKIHEATVYLKGSDGQSRPTDQHFSFNGVFPENATNSQVFEETLGCNMELLNSGYNCTLFAYGMTGSGKTYTMFGDLCNEQNPAFSLEHGLISLATERLFERDLQMDSSLKIRVSYLEIYNEQAKDLLSEKKENLLIVEDPLKGTVVANLLEPEISDLSSLQKLICKGNAKRTMAPTFANAFSSRSHAILQVTVCRTIIEKGTEKVMTSKLSMIDLAGSERAAVNENRGIRFTEGANINRSLLSLGKCIAILSDQSKKGAFVPYRDSKLTRLLKDSLGGNSRAIMVACISQHFTCYEETMNTLKYASRAKNIRKNLRQNKADAEMKIWEYKEIIDSLRTEIHQLKSQIMQPVPGTQGSSLLTPKANGGTSAVNYEKESMAMAEVEKEVERASERLFANLEEHWELTQSLSDLQELKKQNETRFLEVSAKIKKSESDPVSLNETEKEAVKGELESLKKTLANNDAIQQECEEKLTKNLEEKKMLKQQMNLISQNTTIFQKMLREKRESDRKIKELENEIQSMRELVAQKDAIIQAQNSLLTSKLRKHEAIPETNYESKKKRNGKQMNVQISSNNANKEAMNKSTNDLVKKYYKSTLNSPENPMGNQKLGLGVSNGGHNASHPHLLLSQKSINLKSNTSQDSSILGAKGRFNIGNHYQAMLSSNLQLHKNESLSSQKEQKKEKTPKKEEQFLSMKKTTSNEKRFTFETNCFAELSPKEHSKLSSGNFNSKMSSGFKKEYDVYFQPELNQNHGVSAFEPKKQKNKSTKGQETESKDGTITLLKEFSSKISLVDFDRVASKAQRRNKRHQTSGWGTSANKEKSDCLVSNKANSVQNTASKKEKAETRPVRRMSLEEVHQSEKNFEEEKERELDILPTFKGDISSIIQLPEFNKGNEDNEADRSFVAGLDLLTFSSVNFRRGKNAMGSFGNINEFSSPGKTKENYRSGQDASYGMRNYDELRLRCKMMKQEVAKLAQEVFQKDQIPESSQKDVIAAQYVDKILQFLEDYNESGVALVEPEKGIIERLARSVNWENLKNQRNLSTNNRSASSNRWVSRIKDGVFVGNIRISREDLSGRDYSSEKTRGPRNEVKELIRRQQEHIKEEVRKSENRSNLAYNCLMGKHLEF